MPLLDGVEVVLMNERELFTLTGENSISDAVSGLRAHGIEQVVVKVGEMGSIVVTPERSELVEALEIDGVVDTTGAGDVYTAAFVGALLEGHDLLRAAWLGNVAGALTTREIGAQRVVIDRDTLLARHAHEVGETARARRRPAMRRAPVKRRPRPARWTPSRDAPADRRLGVALQAAPVAAAHAPAAVGRGRPALRGRLEAGRRALLGPRPHRDRLGRGADRRSGPSGGRRRRLDACWRRCTRRSATTTAATSAPRVVDEQREPARRPALHRLLRPGPRRREDGRAATRPRADAPPEAALRGSRAFGAGPTASATCASTTWCSPVPPMARARPCRARAGGAGRSSSTCAATPAAAWSP
jgi:hypothetical protein